MSVSLWLEVALRDSASPPRLITSARRDLMKSATSSCFGWLAAKVWPTPRFVTFKQAQEAGGSVRKGEHGTKVYFVKQLRVTEGEGEDVAERLVPMMREYTVFNVAQCEGLPASIMDGKPARVRNPDTRDALADEFLTPRRADDFAQPAVDLFFLADLSDLARLEHFFHWAPEMPGRSSSGSWGLTRLAGLVLADRGNTK